MTTRSEGAALLQAAHRPAHALPVWASPLILFDKVQVVAADGDGARHLGAVHHATQDAPADGHVARERALLVNVGACTAAPHSSNTTLACWSQHGQQRVN